MEGHNEGKEKSADPWDNLEIHLQGLSKGYESTSNKYNSGRFDSVPLSSNEMQLYSQWIQRESKKQNMQKYYGHLVHLLEEKTSKIEAEFRLTQKLITRTPQKPYKSKQPDPPNSEPSKTFLRRSSKSYRLARNSGELDAIESLQFVAQLTESSKKSTKDKATIPPIKTKDKRDSISERNKAALQPVLKVVKEVVNESTPRDIPSVPVKPSPRKIESKRMSIVFNEEEEKAKKKLAEQEARKAKIEKLKEEHAKKLQETQTVKVDVVPKKVRKSKIIEPTEPKPIEKEELKQSQSPKKTLADLKAARKSLKPEVSAKQFDQKQSDDIKKRDRSKSISGPASPTKQLIKKAEAIQNKLEIIRPQQPNSKLEELTIERDDAGKGKSVTSKTEDIKVEKKEDETITTITKISVTISKENEQIKKLSDEQHPSGVEAPPVSPVRKEEQIPIPKLTSEELKAKEDDIFGKLDNIFGKKPAEKVIDILAQEVFAAREVDPAELPLKESDCPSSTTVTSTFFKKLPLPSTIPVPTSVANPNPAIAPKYTSLPDNFIKIVTPGVDKPCPVDSTDLEEIMENFLPKEEPHD